MVQINFARREVQCKVVYYGPQLSGKTTNLRQIYDRTPEKVRGQLTSIATDTNRTLFFDFIPMNLGLVGEVRAKINLYAIPYIEGQNALRLLVLEGVDGIVFVADSSPDQARQNREALENLHENINHLGRDIREIPLVFQWNKRDVEDALPIEALESELNPGGLPSFNATAALGKGIFSTLKAITHGVLLTVSRLVVAPAAQPAAPAPGANVPGVTAVRSRRPLPAAEAAPEALQERRWQRPPAEEPEALPEPQREPEPLPEPVAEELPAFADASAGASHLAFDDVGFPAPEEQGGGAPPEEAPRPAIVPPWRMAKRRERPEVAHGSDQFQLEAPPADSNAVPMESAVAEPKLPREDIPRSADIAGGAPPRTPRGYGETETSLVEPSGGGWSDYEPAAEEPVDEGWQIAVPEPEPVPTGRVRVGGPRAQAQARARARTGWDAHTPNLYAGVGRRHDARPVVDRRKKPRLKENVETLSRASLVAGSLVALAALIVTGVLVHLLL